MSKISNIGYRLVESLIEKILVTKDCWTWKGKVSGYRPHIRPYVKVKGQWRSATREFYKQMIGPIPEGFCVLHSCDNGLCLRPSHLWLGTLMDNTRDMIHKGRDVRRIGEDHWRTKLTKNDVIEMRSLYFQKNLTLSELSKKYSLDKSHIWKICHKKRWPHVQ